MTVNKLYPSLRSAYRKNRSTETALLKITIDILLDMNKQHVTLLVLLDFRAEFDTINHDNLLENSTGKLGIEGVILQWFCSYLQGHSESS